MILFKAFLRILFCQREKDSNPHKQSQSLAMAPGESAY